MQTVIDPPSKFAPKLKNALDKDVIAQRIASGESNASIAEDYPVTPARISQIKKQQKEKIEKYASKYIALLPDIYETSKDDIETGKHLAKLAKVTKGKLTPEQVAYKAQVNKISGDILRSVGILPANTMGTVIQNIYNDNSTNNTLITPQFQKFLDIMSSQDGEEVVYHDQISASNGDELNE